MKLNNFFIVFTLICISICLPVNAINETPIIEQVTMHIYGNAEYANGLPLPAGTVIIAKDQFGSRIGSYTIREKGKIGKEFGGLSENFAINVWRNQSDRTNRTLPIYVSLYIDNTTVGNILPFQQNENLLFNIRTSYLPTIPTQLTTPTQLISQTTIIPAPSMAIPSTPINIATSSNETIPNIPEDPLNFGWTANDYILYGILATIVIIIGIAISGIILSYVIDKTSRDNIMNPDGEWKDK